MSFFGPPRPPKKDDLDNNKNNEKNKETLSIGPELPKKDSSLPVGPTGPTKKKIGPSFDDFSKDEVESNQQEPLQPQNQPPNPKKRVYGPSLNDDNENEYNKPREEFKDDSLPSPLKKIMVGPSKNDIINNGDDDDDDDDDSNLGEWELIKKQRDQELSNKSLDSNGNLKREEWMTTLPTERKIGSQLGNRTFSKNSNVDVNKVDKSWLENDKDNINNDKSNDIELMRKELNNNKKLVENNKIENDIKKYNDANRPKSLYEMHLEKLKKETKKTKGTAPTTPINNFDRNKDMQISKVDREYLSKIVNTAHELGDKFR